jgi:hypothetical protein
MKRSVLEAVEEAVSALVESGGTPHYLAHARDRMAERGVKESDVVRALLIGRVVEGYAPGAYPRGETAGANVDPVFGFEAFVGTQTLAVAVAFRRFGRRVALRVVTVYWHEAPRPASPVLH